MAWVREDECVGCAECIGCGRKYKYHMVCMCDHCDYPIYDTGYVDPDTNEQLCYYCAADVLLDKCVKETGLEDCDAKYIDPDFDSIFKYFGVRAQDKFYLFDPVYYNESEEVD